MAALKNDGDEKHPQDRRESKKTQYVLLWIHFNTFDELLDWMLGWMAGGWIATGGQFGRSGPAVAVSLAVSLAIHLRSGITRLGIRTVGADEESRRR